MANVKEYRGGNQNEPLHADKPEDPDKNADIYTKVPQTAAEAEAEAGAEPVEKEEPAEKMQVAVPEDRPKRPSPHERRMQAVANRRKARDGEEVAPEVPYSEPDIEMGDNFRKLRGKDKVEEPVEKAGEVKTEEPPPAKRKLRVDHRDVEVTEAEYEEAARIGLAQGNRLNELNTLLQQTRAQLAEMRNLPYAQQNTDSSASQQTETGARTAAQQPSRADEDALRDIADKLQTGDLEEGAKALEALLSRAAPQQQASPDEIAASVEARLMGRRQVEQAAAAFSQSHPEIAADQVMQGATVMAMHSIVMDQIAALAPQINVTPEQLTPAMRDPKVAFDWYNQYRQSGYSLLDPNEVSERAARAVETRYRLGGRGAEQPQQSVMSGDRTEQRVAEKRQNQQQPRRANVVTRQSPEAPQPKSRSDVIAGMRAQRHYTNL